MKDVLHEVSMEDCGHTETLKEPIMVTINININIV